jgi:hypothetical protein
MGTYGAGVASGVLDCLSATGVEFTVLHREHEIATESVTSDIDIATSVEPDVVMSEMRTGLAGVDLRPVMRWPYDRNSVTYFLANSDASVGAQLDLVHDPTGRGRYGFRTPALIDRAVDGTRWSRLHPDDELLYLVRKRQVKRDEQATEQLLSEVPAAEVESLVQRARVAFRPGAAQALEEMLRTRVYTDPGSAAFDRRLRHVAATAAHSSRRLRERVGYWVAARGTDGSTMHRTLEPFRRLLPSVVVAEAGDILFRYNHLVRPRLVVTTGEPSRRADTSVTFDDDVAFRTAVVSAMAERLERR